MSVGVAVEEVALALGAFHLGTIDFALSRSEILVILGPNGAGKSLTLETIAGFYRPASGRILIAGRDVTALPPERRNVGFMVQNFGLFPHFNVAQNIAIAGRGAAPRPQSSAGPPHGDPAALMSYFGIAHLASRFPQDLSPGEKQRVALARALASAPDVFLFDEPFAALDTQTRDQLRDELRTFLRQLAIPAIFVTHDHSDAMTLADRVVVLRAGSLMQSGPARDIFQKPANEFVARFVGVENVLPAVVREVSCGTAAVDIAGRTLRAAAPEPDAVASARVLLAIRAEDVTVLAPQSARSPAPGANHLSGRVTGQRQTGPLMAIEIDCGFPLKALLLAPQARQLGLEPGHPVEIAIAIDAIHLMRQ